MSDDNSPEAILLKTRELLKTIETAVAGLRLSLGVLMPVVVSATPQIPRALAEVVNAHDAVDEPLTNALGRIIEARAHLAVAQGAMPAFVRVRDRHRQAVVDLAAERRAEDGEKPS